MKLRTFKAKYETKNNKIYTRIYKAKSYKNALLIAENKKLETSDICLFVEITKIKLEEV